MIRGKFIARLDHQRPKAALLTAALEAFRSDVSILVNQLVANSSPMSHFPSLAWAKLCLDLLPSVHKAFAKLVVKIDYPMCKWESLVTEEYLSYTLSLLDLLNAATSSLSYLDHARLAICHGLSLVKNSPSSALKHLKRIQPSGFPNDLRVDVAKKGQDTPSSEKEGVIHQALLIMKSTSYWTFAVILSGLCSDVGPYTVLRDSAARFDECLIKGLDARFGKEMVERLQGGMKEVREVNDAADELVAVVSRKDKKRKDVAKELNRRLEVLGTALTCVKNHTNCLFSEVLAARDELLHCLRRAISEKI